MIGFLFGEAAVDLMRHSRGEHVALRVVQPRPDLLRKFVLAEPSGERDATLDPSASIRQNELAEKLGVSRQPVSHALHLLHRQGLVAESGRRGFEVTRLDPERIRQLYEVRGAIDALAARLAARRADGAERAQLEAALHAGRAIDRRTPLSERIALDVDFHRAIYRFAGNPAVEEMMAPQWPHMRRSMATAHPRMIDPVEQIFGAKVYMHQYKINAKSAFTGDVWQWHQDYGTWKRDDGMPQPRAMNIAIFLDGRSTGR
ncbi:FCD domain-containing protein [Bradyrhizobium sp.]|uniref:FCD domain-containing protein n=1 Tax=Bradyrhizobium sp. TaxID=376 RepID=UPI003438B75D